METTTQETNYGLEQAKAQYDTIVRLINALDTDFEALADATHELQVNNDDTFQTTYDELTEQAAGYTNRDDVFDAIRENALSVEVRSDWCNAGDTQALAMPSGEFRIVLCTGGPHVQIRGEYSEGQPKRAWLEYSDWGTGLVQYSDAPQDVLLTYANEFYFG